MAWKLLLPLALLTLPIVAGWGGGWLMALWSGRERVAPVGLKPLYQRLSYDLDDVKEYWAGFGDGLPAERLFLKLDLVFPLVYGGAFAASLLLAWEALGRPVPPRWLLAPVVLTMLSDWTENLVQLAQIERYLGRGGGALQEGRIRVASLATAVKLISLVGCFVALVILVGVLCIRDRLSRWFEHCAFR